MTLDTFNQMYEEILQSNIRSTQKDRQLAQLMTMMEKTYRIPMLKNVRWEEGNREVILLYKRISLSRTL